jgi:hypothetical protein
MLLFIEDGNPDSTADGLINWDKWQMAAQVIKDVRQYQQTTYAFEKVEFISNFFYANKDSPLSEEEAYKRSYQLEAGRMPLVVAESIQESTRQAVPNAAPAAKEPTRSPNASSRWQTARADKNSDDRAPALKREQGVEDARQSLNQLNTATGNALVQLLGEWVAKTRAAAYVIHESFSAVQGTVSSGSPLLKSEEERSYCVYYASVLTGSKAVEGVIGKLLGGSLTSALPLIYEWASYMLVGTATFTRQVVDAVQALSKLNPPSELIMPVVNAVCSIKIPPLDAKKCVEA